MVWEARKGIKLDVRAFQKKWTKTLGGSGNYSQSLWEHWRAHWMLKSISGSGKSFLAEMIRDRECQCSSASFSLHWRARYWAQRKPSAALSLDWVRDLISMPLVKTPAGVQWKPEQVPFCLPQWACTQPSRAQWSPLKYSPLLLSPPQINPLKKKTKNTLILISNRFFQGGLWRTLQKGDLWEAGVMSSLVRERMYVYTWSFKLKSKKQYTRQK